MSFVPSPDSVGITQYAQAGYYLVGNKKFYSNIHAFAHAKKTNTPVSWYFYDDIWEEAHTAGQWKYQTLDQLYDMRARQIRQQYDHITISSSGGWDSRNIIEVFERNNLRIDCILIQVAPELNTTTSPTDFSPANWNGEVIYHAEPYAYQYIKRHPETKLIRSEWISEAKRYCRDVETLITMSHHRIGLTGARFTAVAKNAEFLAQTNNKNACIITGTDKPCIIINSEHANGFITEGIIRHMNWFCLSDKNWPSNVIHENFYWTPDLPELVVRGWYELLSLCNTDDQVKKAHNATVPLANRLWCKASMPVQNKLRKMLYRGFNPVDWQTNKPTAGAFFQELDLPILKMLEADGINVKGILGDAIRELVTTIGENHAVFAEKLQHGHELWVDRRISDNQTMIDFKPFITRLVPLDSTFRLTQENYF